MLRSLYTIFILVPVGMHITANEAAARRITVIAFFIGILAIQRDWIVTHLAILAVSRVATLTCCSATL